MGASNDGRAAQRTAIHRTGAFASARPIEDANVTPEAARGGLIAVVADGDRIVVDLSARKLDLDVAEADIALRWKAYVAPEPRVKRGYLKFYSEHVAPASEGAVMPRV